VRGMPRLLVIDENDDIRLFLRDRLSVHGYDVDIAAGWPEVRVSDVVPYDGVLFDVMPSSMPWLVAFDELRARLKELPMIAMSVDHSALQLALRRGADAAIPKPIAFDRLHATVRAVLESRRQNRSA